MITWEEASSERPLIAILRGLDPDRALDVADLLVETGFRILEVPLNSPAPLESIQRIARRYGQQIIVGAGTVLSANQVDSVVEAGGRIIVSPNTDARVGRRAVKLGATWCPGVLSPTEAFSALSLGASVLKFFPAELVSPGAISAVRAVLPDDTMVAVVGGITPETLAHYHAAGANCFGLGSALFKPELKSVEIAERASAFIEAHTKLVNPQDQ
ncbi:2-dehydro-3-deoxy-6-phosphogalactonate aldolase [Granulosicoccus sp. 3-233]|uniref:2-dehydro-3-deoxy-6-phosphogalactonate aldolase n=1 Tax=Granulosicoccus sp. 3-233 TaxID=3417969 RepID=UPI003D340060